MVKFIRRKVKEYLGFKQGQTLRDRIAACCDRVIEIALYVLVFGVTFSKAIPEVAAGVAITAWILKKIISRSFRLVQTDLNYALLGFLLINLISLVNVINTDYSAVSIKGFFGKVVEYVLLFFVIVESVNTKRQFRNILRVMFFTFVLIGIDGIFQQIFGIDYMRLRRPMGCRISAGFENPNHFGGWLAMVFPVPFALFLTNFTDIKKRKKIKIFLGALCVLLFTCLILVDSHGAYLGFIGALFLVGVLLRNRKSFLIILICILMLPLVIILTHPRKQTMVAFDSDQGIFDINQKTFDFEQGTNLERAQRTILWRETLPMIKDKPLLGHGVNSFMNNWSKYRVGEKWGGPYYPHNCYLHMAAEIGIIGLSIFTWLIIMLFSSTIKFLRKMKIETDEDRFYRAIGLGMLGGITACLIHSFVDNNLYILLLATYFWILVSLVNAEKKIYEGSTT